MDSFTDTKTALAQLLTDDSAIEFTWRQPEFVQLGRLTESQIVSALLGRMSASDVCTTDGIRVVKTGAVFDSRTISAVVAAGAQQVSLTPLPSIVTVHRGAAQTATLLQALLSVAGYQNFAVATSEQLSAARALVAEHVRTQWTDLVIIIDSPGTTEIYPNIAWYATPVSPSVAIGIGTAHTAGWELPLVVLPSDSFAAWIGMRQIVLPALAESLGSEYRRSSTLVQLRVPVETSRHLEQIVPARIARGFAEPISTEQWASADGYLVLPADTTLEAGTPVEALLP